MREEDEENQEEEEDKAQPVSARESCQSGPNLMCRKGRRDRQRGLKIKLMLANDTLLLACGVGGASICSFLEIALYRLP